LNWSWTTQAQLIRFVNRDNITVEQEWTDNAVKLDIGLDHLFVQGGQSAVVDAVYLAVKDLTKRRKAFPDRRQAVVLISDGEDRDSFYSEIDIYKLLKDSGIEIFTIAMTANIPSKGRTADKNSKSLKEVRGFVQRLAANSGGAVYELRDMSDNDITSQQLRSLMDELRAQYVISYTPLDITDENNVRSIKVSVTDAADGSKRKVIARSSITLLPPEGKSKKKR